MAYVRDWNEQNISKKDSDASTAASGARDKRCAQFEPRLASILLTIHLSFRRDQEEAGTVPIPVFRVHPFTYHLVSGSSPAHYLPFNALTTFANGEL